MTNEFKVKLRGVLPKGAANGLGNDKALQKLLDGFPRGVKHVAVVTLDVSDVTQDATGTSTPRVSLASVELVEGPSAEQALKLLRAEFGAREGTPLPGMEETGVDYSAGSDDRDF